VSAAPAAAQPDAVNPLATEKKPVPAAVRYALVGAGAVALFLLTAFAPTQLLGNFTVFVLAIVIGYYVIGKVNHALHTPLMSVTNAISGIVVIGAILQIGHSNMTITVLSFIAILVASINVFGGFAVTRRMLRMFSKG
jgi:NAD(P) transhydrogenase subunit alpha